MSLSAAMKPSTVKGDARSLLARHRELRIYLAGQTVSVTGTWMQQVAMGWLALTLSNDPFIVGLVSAASTLPVFFFALPAGVLADRWARLTLVRIAQTLMLVNALVLWWFARYGELGIGGLVASALVSGVLTALDTPARQSLIVQLAGADDLLGALALNSAAFNLARLVGPSLAAVVIAHLGIASCFGLNAVSYLALLLALRAIPVVAAPAANRSWRSVGSELRAPLEFAAGDGTTRWLLGTVTLVAALTSPVMTLLPIIARDSLALDASGYSALMMCFGAGALVGAATIRSAQRLLGSERLLAFAAACAAAAMGGLAYTPLAFACGLLVVSGASAMYINALTNSMLQERIPAILRGRVTSLQVMLYLGATAAGAAIWGWVSSRTDVTSALAIAATLLALVAARLAHRAFR